MSQEIINILESQIPLFDKLRRSAMLTNAMRATVTKAKMLQYVNEVNTSLEIIIQLNQRTIAQMQEQLTKEENHDDTPTSNENSAASGETEINAVDRP